MSARSGTSRLVIGGALNVVLMAFVVSAISDQYMAWAATMLGERVAWPQIGFMSAYPKDVRNGYLLFVLAVFTGVLLSSGLFGGLLGASPGKWITGVRCKSVGGGTAGLGRMLIRATLYCVTLAPILLVGPILGFVFGEVADPFSLAALAGGCLLFIALTCWPVWSDARLSWLNHTSGVEPVSARRKEN